MLPVHIIGVSLDLGGNRRGVDMGPSAFRIAGLGERLHALGIQVVDEGDLVAPIPETKASGDPAKKYIREIARVCERLYKAAHAALDKGALPLVLGGDHSLAAGSVAATAAKDALALGQGIQFQVADNAIDLQVAETLALHCATLADTGALTDADLSLTRFVVLEAFERVSRRAAHIAGLFAPTPPEWTRFFLDLARRLRLEGGAVELDRREAALGVLQNV